jgi:hypothetical protein
MEEKMNELLNSKSIEKGQVLVLVVLMMFAIIGMVALILDGGDIMSNRRTAQAAADAGALAGAQTVCMGNGDPVTVAQTYALKNGATTAVATLNGQEVTVVASVENASFFAKIFEEDNLVANADATAGCYYPSVAKRILPIAFYYQDKPENAGDMICSEENPCDLVNWDFDELMTGLNTPVYDYFSKVIYHPLDNIYIISDSIKVCEKDYTGEIVCSDVIDGGGGARTYIDLTHLLAQTDPNNLSFIIQNGVSKSIHLPAWFNVEGAVNAAVYDEPNYTDFEEIEGYDGLEARLFFVPVYDKFCETDPKVNCSTDPEDHFEYLKNTNQASYRLIGFAPFMVTGVTKTGGCEFGADISALLPEEIFEFDSFDLNIAIKKNAPLCPGYALYKAQLEAFNEGKSPQDQLDISNNAIEGYFIDEIPADQYLWGTEGVDVGVYLISLSD